MVPVFYSSFETRNRTLNWCCSIVALGFTRFLLVFSWSVALICWERLLSKLTFCIRHNWAINAPLLLSWSKMFHISAPELEPLTYVSSGGLKCNLMHSTAKLSTNSQSNRQNIVSKLDGLHSIVHRFWTSVPLLFVAPIHGSWSQTGLSNGIFPYYSLKLSRNDKYDKYTLKAWVCWCIAIEVL